MRKKAGWCLIVLMLVSVSPAIAASPAAYRIIRHHHHHRIHQAGWAGAGLAAGQAIGPAGSAAVGATKYRHDLKAGGRRRTHAIAKIGGPIAAGAVAGPVGSAAYVGVGHRNL